MVIDPFIWAPVWGVNATLSATAWTYWLPPHRYRILGLGRLGTSVAMGLVIGIPIFLTMLTRVFLQAECMYACIKLKPFMKWLKASD